MKREKKTDCILLTSGWSGQYATHLQYGSVTTFMLYYSPISDSEHLYAELINSNREKRASGWSTITCSIAGYTNCETTGIQLSWHPWHPSWHPFSRWHFDYKNVSLLSVPCVLLIDCMFLDITRNALILISLFDVKKKQKQKKSNSWKTGVWKQNVSMSFTKGHGFLIALSEWHQFNKCLEDIFLDIVLWLLMWSLIKNNSINVYFPF